MEKKIPAISTVSLDILRMQLNEQIHGLINIYYDGSNVFSLIPITICLAIATTRFRMELCIFSHRNYRDHYEACF